MFGMFRNSISAGLILFAALICCPFSSAQHGKQVQKIRIHSGWGGLGTPQDATIIITRNKRGFVRDGEPVAPPLVDALVASLKKPRIAKPDLANLGITGAWLKSQLNSREPKSNAQATETTKGQRALFESSFTNPKFVADRLHCGFEFWHTDDYPRVRVEVSFEDGTKLTAFTRSQNVFMLPWCIGNAKGTALNGCADQKDANFNADISRAVSALLPEETVNKDRLAGAALAEDLTQAVMNSIEAEWNLRGAEDMVGGALATLRRKYQVTAATIDPWLRPEYGPREYDSEAPQMNLHAFVRKASFPPNAVDAVALRKVNSDVEGVQGFLDSGGRYEDLVFSVPWLSEYIRQHPKVFFRISYVDNASLGEKAMWTFSGDMKLRERGDLVEKVSKQQSQIALLMVGMEDAEAYWLVFPDKHMLLWRYQGPGGLLKWSPADFGEGECADYRVNDGGCSGREVSPDGTLIPEGTPRDVACVASWHAEQPQTGPPPDPLFEVEDHDRGGFIDRNGAVAIPLCFDAVGDFSEGLARFERDGRWGYLDATGTIVIQPVFPWAEEFHEGLAHVQVTGTTLGYDGKWGYIDKSGKVVIAADYSRMMGDEGGAEAAFHDGLAVVEVESESIPPKKGFIDKSGRIVIAPRFTYGYPFSEGLAAVTESESGDMGWGYIDKTGNWVIPPKFEWATSFQFGLAAVNRKKDCGYIDRTDTYAIRLASPEGNADCASAWGDFGDGLSRWLFGTKYGFIDRYGKTVIQPRFDLTFGFSEGLAAVQVGKQWGYIDTSGNIVVQPRELSFAKPFHNGLARVGIRDGGWGYLNRGGQYVWQSTPSKR